MSMCGSARRAYLRVVAAFRGGAWPSLIRLF